MNEIGKATRRRRVSSTYGRELGMYLRYVAALVRPGVKMPVFDAHRLAPGDLSTWNDEEKMLLIEEGRRQFDRQASDLEKIRGRSQLVMTTALALGATLSGILRPIAAAGLGAFLCWTVALVLLLLVVLGSGAIVSTSAELETVDAALLSSFTPPILDTLAAGYATAAKTGENTVATRLTMFRMSVFLLVLAALFESISWWLSVAG